jgi:hypothetical protein
LSTPGQAWRQGTANTQLSQIVCPKRTPSSAAFGFAPWPPGPHRINRSSALAAAFRQPPQPHTRPGWGPANLICLPKSIPSLHNFDVARPKRLPSATALPPPIRQIVRNNSSTSDYPRYTTERHPSLECHRFHTLPLLHCNKMFLDLSRFL